MAVEQNVTPILVEGETDVNALIEKGLAALKEKGYLQAGNVVVLRGGSLNGTSI